jgi:hypothetical protein
MLTPAVASAASSSVSFRAPRPMELIARSPEDEYDWNVRLLSLP